MSSSNDPQPSTSAPVTVATVNPRKRKRNYSDADLSHITTKVSNEQTLLYECTICRKTFKTKNHQRYHLYCRNDLDLEKPFTCSTCSQQFINKSHYDYHTNTSHGNPNDFPYSCVFCDSEVNPKRFPTQNKLFRHIRGHTREKPFICDICDKSFSTSSLLVSHKYIHSPEPQFPCKVPKCKKKFKTPSIRDKHSKYVHGDCSFRCVFEGCSKTFRSKDGVNYHYHMAHTNGSYFKCKYVKCRQLTTTQKDARRHYISCHIMSKHGEFSYKCPTDGNTFTRRDNLKRHLMKSHGNCNQRADKLAKEICAEVDLRVKSALPEATAICERVTGHGDDDEENRDPLESVERSESEEMPSDGDEACVDARHAEESKEVLASILNVLMDFLPDVQVLPSKRGEPGNEQGLGAPSLESERIGVEDKLEASEENSEAILGLPVMEVEIYLDNTGQENECLNLLGDPEPIADPLDTAVGIGNAAEMTNARMDLDEGMVDGGAQDGEQCNKEAVAEVVENIDEGNETEEIHDPGEGEDVITLEFMLVDEYAFVEPNDIDKSVKGSIREENEKTAGNQDFTIQEGEETECTVVHENLKCECLNDEEFQPDDWFDTIRSSFEKKEKPDVLELDFIDKEKPEEFDDDKEKRIVESEQDLDIDRDKSESLPVVIVGSRRNQDKQEGHNSNPDRVSNMELTVENAEWESDDDYPSKVNTVNSDHFEEPVSSQDSLDQPVSDHGLEGAAHDSQKTVEDQMEITASQSNHGVEETIIWESPDGSQIDLEESQESGDTEEENRIAEITQTRFLDPAQGMESDNESHLSFCTAKSHLSDSGAIPVSSEINSDIPTSNPLVADDVISLSQVSHPISAEIGGDSEASSIASGSIASTLSSSTRAAHGNHILKYQKRSAMINVMSWFSKNEKHCKRK